MSTDRNYYFEVKGFGSERAMIDVVGKSIFEAAGALVRVLEVAADATSYNAEYLTIEASARSLEPPVEAVAPLRRDTKERPPSA